jgi:hypothetical protein
VIYFDITNNDKLMLARITFFKMLMSNVASEEIIKTKGSEVIALNTSLSRNSSTPSIMLISSLLRGPEYSSPCKCSNSFSPFEVSIEYLVFHYSTLQTSSSVHHSVISTEDPIQQLSNGIRNNEQRPNQYFDWPCKECANLESISTAHCLRNDSPPQH